VSTTDLRDGLLREHGRVISAIRISVGVATNFADVHRFMCFLQGFVDRTVDDIGHPAFLPSACRTCRDRT
jgi:hypothetical protein